MCATLSSERGAAMAPSVANVARGLCPDNINMRRSAGVRGAARCHAIQRSQTHTRCTQTALRQHIIIDARNPRHSRAPVTVSHASVPPLALQRSTGSSEPAPRLPKSRSRLRPSLRSDAISFWPTRTRLCARPGREVPSDPRSAWRRLAVGVLCHPLFVRSFVRAERSVWQN